MRFTRTITVILVIVTTTVSLVCNYEDSVVLTNRTYNYLKYYGRELFIDNKTGEERGCVCVVETCTRKCCPSFGQIFDPNLNKCFDHSTKFDPSVWDGSNQKQGFNAVKEFHVLMSELKCSKDKKEYKIVVGEATEKYHLTKDGQLYVFMETSLPQYQFIGPDKYCIDNFLGPDNSTIKINALMCYVAIEKANSYVKTASCMLVSCFFIILTISVYAFLPDLRSTTHGMIMITYLMSFFVTFLFMATMQLQLYMKNISQIMCTSMTFIIYYSALAAFFWMNVMCYDLWWKFRIVHVASHGVLAKGRNRFVWYSVYAFGIPLIFTILVAALEFSADLEKHNKYLPNIRVQSCFIDGTSKWIYLYSPMILICIINLVLFIFVAIRIAHIKKQTQRLKKKDTQRFTLYIKLFIITGINWILEAISEMFPDINYLWSITDVYNVLIGFIIFVIFVCKKKIFIDIQKRYKDISRKVGEENQPSTTLTSVASQSPEEVQMESNISNESILEKNK